MTQVSSRLDVRKFHFSNPVVDNCNCICTSVCLNTANHQPQITGN